jgi:hypothetical protein
MSGLEQFPVVGDLNVYRYRAFQASHDIEIAEPKPMPEKIASWLGHKAVSVICIPANCLAVSLGIAGMTLTAATLGAAKVATFALTLGAIKPEFSIGFLWLGERSITSIIELLSNAGELIYDTADLGYQGYKGVRWVLSALKLDYISTKLRQMCEIVLDRVAVGLENARNDEKTFLYKDLFPSPIKALDDATHEQSCLRDDQSMERWFAHKLLSVVNIPANAALFVASSIGGFLGVAALTTKVALFAITNIQIRLPIGYSAVADVALSSGSNVLRNGFEVVLDVGLPVYKMAEALHLTKVAATVRDLVVYTFSAICS